MHDCSKQAFQNGQRLSPVYRQVKWDLEVEQNVPMKVPERRLQALEARCHSCEVSNTVMLTQTAPQNPGVLRPPEVCAQHVGS